MHKQCNATSSLHHCLVSLRNVCYCTLHYSLRVTYIFAVLGCKGAFGRPEQVPAETSLRRGQEGDECIRTYVHTYIHSYILNASRAGVKINTFCTGEYTYIIIVLIYIYIYNIYIYMYIKINTCLPARSIPSRWVPAPGPSRPSGCSTAHLLLLPPLLSQR